MTLAHPRRAQSRPFICYFILLGLMLGGAVAEMQAEIFVVNSTADAPSFEVGNGVCETAAGSSECTLRAAIQEANSNSADDTIFFVIPETDSGFDGTSFTINLASALPDLKDNISLRGSGPDLLTVRRDTAVEFSVFTVASKGLVSFYGMTISNGSAVNGGGINHTDGGTVDISLCKLLNNTAAEDGGGINNALVGTVTARFTTFTGNVAGAKGGGMENDGTGNLNVAYCTLSENSAAQGGAINNQNRGGLFISNCTITQNIGSGAGGIRQAAAGTANVSASTITGNEGLGLFNSDEGTFNVKNCIIASNIAGASSFDVAGHFLSSGFNFIGIADSTTSFTRPSDQKGTIDAPADPLLDPDGLKDNGGPTETIALDRTSPALDAGSSAGLDDELTTDQRGIGYARTYDAPEFPNAGGGDGTDIGAFEVQTIVPLSTRFRNLSTRLIVGRGAFSGIGGFIISGSRDKSVLIRALGPSLGAYGVTGTLADPVLEIHDGTGALIASNDNWKDGRMDEIQDTGLQPSLDAESAIIQTLSPGLYTAVVKPSGDVAEGGVALVAIYGLEPLGDTTVSNISTRGLVQNDDNVMIGGLIVYGTEPANAVLRALGPSIPLDTNTLADPTLELYDGNGMLVNFNDDWKETQQTEIKATGLAPTKDAESAILQTLNPGAYTAIVRGKDFGTGIALFEAYQL